MLRVVVTPDQWLYSASGSFPVTPGAAFRTGPRSGAGGVDRQRLHRADVFTTDWKEVRRDIHPLGPVPIALGSTVTDATGAFALAMARSSRAAASCRQSTGNATYWPTRAQTAVTVP